MAEKTSPEEIENEELEGSSPSLLKPVPDDGLKRRWYALHVHSGQEPHACEMMLAGAQHLDPPNLITNVLVPMEQVTEIRAGEKKVSKRKFFPGYVLIQLPEHPERYADLWQLINETPGVTGFIGSRNAAVPLEDSEVMAVVEVARGERERPKPKVDFTKGQRVKITEGPFANFLGNVDDINPETGTMKIMVEIFERLTSIEVEFWQVEAIY